MHDFAIIGGGPIGIACGIAAKRAGLSAVVLEKGALVNSMVNYPTDLEFFSTSELLEIGGHPFPSRHYKPRRAEALSYYRQVAFAEDLDIRLYETVTSVEGKAGDFSVITSKGTHRAGFVVVATGFFDFPRLLDVPGEELSKVSHYYKEPYPYSGQRVAVIGGKNSAAKAALDCLRHGAEVTLVHRGAELSDRVKYWIKPDIENRIKEGRITAYFNTTVTEIRPQSVDLLTSEGPQRIENDWVLAMTGYVPDFEMLRRLGIRLRDDEFRTPMHDPETMETNRSGIYLAGVVCGGLNTAVWFIENSRVHADQIVAHARTRSDLLVRASG